MPYLQARNGFDAGRVYELSAGEHYLGRQPDCTVQIELRSVSRRHAKLVIHESSATIEDLGSRNGTLLNRKRITKAESITEGDEIRICDILFSFHNDPPGALPFSTPSTTEVPPRSTPRPPSGSSRSSQTETWQDPDKTDFLPTISAENLRRRAQLLNRARRFFDERDFVEVETPLLSTDTVIDRYIEPIPVILGRQRMWLQTSPEFGMKRMLAAGLPALYQITKAFRQDERGRLHNPEFSILEWYRQAETMEESMFLLSDLCQELLGKPAADIVSYRDVFQEHLQFDPIEGKDTQLIRVIASLDISAPENWRTMDRDGWLNLLLSEFIQPRLGQERPLIMHHYPASQAALAAPDPQNAKLAQRFELFVRGVELANGYHELRDPDELRRRNTAVNAQRRKDGAAALPENSYLLSAMEHGLPVCSGAALGFDRLVMLACGVESLDDVISFPIDRA